MMTCNFFKSVLPLLLCVLLTACGFHLRDHTNIPPQLHVIYLKTPTPYSELSKALTNRFKRVGITLVNSPTEAPYTLEILSDDVIDTLNSVSADTQVRTYTLTYSVKYRLLTNAGNVIQGPITVSVISYYTEQTATALSASNERHRLDNEMRRNIITQLLYRLSAADTRRALNNI